MSRPPIATSGPIDAHGGRKQRSTMSALGQKRTSWGRTPMSASCQKLTLVAAGGWLFAFDQQFRDLTRAFR